ncbi:MAG: chromate transporter [Betaproteobacteria bacterium]
MQIVADIFFEFSQLSFVAFGGANALIPELHRVVVEQRHWLNDTTFANLCAIGQAAPGPNLLVLTLIGWEVAGLAGALAATIALCLPMSVAIFLLFRHWERFRGRRWQQAVQIGVAPLAVGLILSGGVLIGFAASLGAAGWALAAVVAGADLRFKRLHPLWLIALGALAGLSGLI